MLLSMAKRANHLEIVHRIVATLTSAYNVMQFLGCSPAHRTPIPFPLDNPFPLQAHVDAEQLDELRAVRPKADLRPLIEKLLLFSGFLGQRR